jgi:hypothetical protein
MRKKKAYYDPTPEIQRVILLNVPRKTSTKFIAPRPVLSEAEGTPAKQNPKFGYRNPKQTQRLKSQLRNPKRACFERSDS